MSDNFSFATRNHRKWRRLAIIYLTLQSFGATIWWILLWLHPPTRAHFVFPDATDSTLLAFGAPDALLFVGAGLVSAWKITRNSPCARDWLLLHTGSAIYAALYCVHAWILEPRLWPGALAMSPCLIVLPLLLWKLSASNEVAP